MHVEPFYDQLAPFYHLIYPDWEGSIVRQANDLDAIIRAHWGEGRLTILDVACGPGTLSILAAPFVREICALDFSTEMVERVRQRADRAGIRNLAVQVGNGHALPWPDAHFDVGFSMFGVFLFEDRARGLAELRRVVRPGGYVVISSWVAAERPPIIKLIRKALQKHMPGMPDAEQSPFGTGCADLPEPETS